MKRGEIYSSNFQGPQLSECQQRAGFIVARRPNLLRGEEQIKSAAGTVSGATPRTRTPGLVPPVCMDAQRPVGQWDQRQILRCLQTGLRACPPVLSADSDLSC